MQGKKRKMQSNVDDDGGDYDYSEKVYRFQVLLPNGLNVAIVKRNPLGDMPLERLLERVKEKSMAGVRQTESSKPTREVLWKSKDLYLEDALGNNITRVLCFDQFRPNKVHYLRLIDGADQTVNTFENMWDLTPDTELLKELPDDYTFETALADLIDNSLQAVWNNGGNERKLICVEVKEDKVSVFDTGPGMDGTAENSIVKWGKMGASVHRSSKKLAVGGKPPYLTPFFGMFGYGGTIASMHLGRHAVVSAKTMESKKVYWLHLERDALLKKSGSGSDLNWKTRGGIRDPNVDEIEKSPHGSFTKVDVKLKMKIPSSLFQLQCRLKDIYFPYIQCDEISKTGRTTTLVEFEVNGINLAEIDGGEVATTNLHSCHGPDFILNLHFRIEEDNAASKCPSTKASREANAQLKCVYFPIIQGKENIERILEKLKSDGFMIKEDFDSFSRISIRRLGRLLPDARWDLLPFMKPKQKRGDKLQILKRCCSRVKCFIETDAGFNPIPSKTDLAPQHPFTKALKELGVGHLQKEKEVKVEVRRGGKKLALPQLEKDYLDWVLQMHSQYDEEFNCGADEPVLVVSTSNKEALGITSEIVRVHEAIHWKEKPWKRGQKIKVLKGACSGCQKSMYATIDYFLLEGFQGDVGGEGRVICRPLGVAEQDGCVLKVDAAGTRLDLCSSKSLPITVIGSGKCISVGMDDWNCQAEKLNLQIPSAIEVLGLKQCKELDIDGALPTGDPVSAGFIPPKEIVAVLRPSNFTSSSVFNDLDQKYIIKDNLEMNMEIKFKADTVTSCKVEPIFSGSATSTSRRGCQGLYIFSLGSVPNLFQKAGAYTFSFSLRESVCKGCELSVSVKASSMIKHWELVKDDQNLQFDVSAGSCFPPFSVAHYDIYDNCVPFHSIPNIVVQLTSRDVMLCHIKTVKIELSSHNFHLIVKNVRITTDKLDKIRPSYEATLVLSQPDESPILSIPCRVLPGPLKSVVYLSSESGNGLLPKQVVQDAKLEIFDRHGNHVKEDTNVELAVHGFRFLDQIGLERKVDKHGCIDLSGVLKVTAPYGAPVSLSVKSGKDVIYTKKFRVEKRELRLATTVPEICPAGSKLKDLAFEVVNSEGEVDETIHDEVKHNQSHTLTIRTDLPEHDDSLRYAFRHGCCVIPSITLPRREGNFYIEAVHSHHQELHLKFKVHVSQATYKGQDVTSDLQASEEKDDDGISQSSDEEMSSHSVSFAGKNGASFPKFQNRKYDAVSSVQELQEEHRKHISQSFDESIVLHKDSFTSKKATTSARSKLQENQSTPKTPSRLYDPNDELKTDTFQSPEGNMISLDAFTPKHPIRILEPDLQDLQDAEKEIQNRGLLIKEYEEDLKDLEIIRDAAVLSLQASMDVLPLDQSDMSQKEEVSRKIQNKAGLAAAVYSACLRNMPLKELDPTIMANVVGIVALLGTAPTHTLSRVLAEYLGEDQMLAIVRQSSAAVTPSENYERALGSAAAELGMPINGSHLLICLEDIRVYPRGVIEGDPQKRLALPKPALSDGTIPPGFLGYAVNMIEIDADHLQTKTAAGHGLRETLFYRLFGNLQVYDTKEHMEEAHGCISDGAVSLDGGIVRGNGIISVGCKQVDVHFPVVALEHRMVVFPDKPDIKALIGKKETAEEAIAFTNKERNTCLKQFQERYAECCKLIEYKEASQKLQLSQESLKFLPRPSQTSV